MTFTGFLRVKNEARWIERVIHSLRPLCGRIFVFDDKSADDTAAICQRLGCTVYHSTYDGVNETRDKNFLLERIWEEVNPQPRGPESEHWIIAVDGDEELEPNGPDIIRAAAKTGAHALTFKIVYLWDRPDQIRTDGIYGTFHRGSAFRMISPLHAFGHPRKRGRDMANFHCGSVPWDLMSQANTCEARLLHYGYMERDDRIRKYAWYNSLDANNAQEDCYRHMVQGDVPEVPAHFRRGQELLHAGPLCLEPLNALVSA